MPETPCSNMKIKKTKQLIFGENLRWGVTKTKHDPGGSVDKTIVLFKISGLQNYCSLYNCVVKRASCEVERWICCIQIYICRIYCVGYTRNIYYRHEQRHTYMYMLSWATWSRSKRSKFSVVSLLFLRVGLVYFLFLPTVWLFIHSLLIFFFTSLCSLWLLETHTLWFEN